MVTGDDAMANGVGHWCWTQELVTGSLVDDGLHIWISGDWWMMFAMPCLYVLCLFQKL